MKTKDLIVKLQQLVEEHKAVEAMMGEHEIVIDVFGKNTESGQWQYLGFSPYMKIEKSGDGVYDILSAFEL